MRSENRVDLFGRLDMSRNFGCERGMNGMSKLANESIRLLSEGFLEKALKLAYRAIEEEPDNWYCYYALGLALRHLQDFPRAAFAYERSIELNENDENVWLSLAIVRQYMRDFSGTIEALKRALRINPDYVTAYNTLGMTQKLMGEYDKAKHNYETGLEILARDISFSLQNKSDNIIYEHMFTTNNLWVEYSARCVLQIAVRDNVDHIATPDEKFARKVVEQSLHQGLLWIDTIEDGKITRLMLPNFFATLSVLFRRESLFPIMIGNLGTIFDKLGEHEKATQYWQEADELTS